MLLSYYRLVLVWIFIVRNQAENTNKHFSKHHFHNVHVFDGNSRLKMVNVTSSCLVLSDRRNVVVLRMRSTVKVKTLHFGNKMNSSVDIAKVYFINAKFVGERIEEDIKDIAVAVLGRRASTDVMSYDNGDKVTCNLVILLVENPSPWKPICYTNMILETSTTGGDTNLCATECKQRSCFQWTSEYFSCACENQSRNQSSGFNECGRGIDECLSNPCTSNGKCITNKNSFTCQCDAGYTGINCEQDINECSSNPCYNKGRCVNAVSEYVCICTDSYLGVNCNLNQPRMSRSTPGIPQFSDIIVEAALMIMFLISVMYAYNIKQKLLHESNIAREERKKLVTRIVNLSDREPSRTNATLSKYTSLLDSKIGVSDTVL